MKAKIFTSQSALFLIFTFLFFSFSNFLSAQCNADFSFHDYDGPMPVVGGITFENTSTGNFTNLSWNFGDGAYCSEQSSSYTHVYNQSGTYEVSLMIWNSDQTCNSIHTATVDVFVPDDPCEVLDCVWPGDTNGDGVSTMVDLLNIGVGFNVTGPERSDASSEWEAQPAEDWDMSMVDGVNYKHLDCNGDGIINLFDLSPIWEYNSLLETLGNQIPVDDGPEISLQFDVDTVLIDETSGETTTINASLTLGQSSYPMEDIYGLALYVNYPKQWVDSSSAVVADYDHNSFFGDQTETLNWDVDTRAAGQVDFAMARLDGQNTSGYGRVANVSFIIIHDIVDGREEMQGRAFEVEIEVVKVIDKFGNEKEVSFGNNNASVFFVNGFTTTSTVDPELSAKVNVFPNPTTDVLNIDLGELQGESLELYNVLGQMVVYEENINENHQLSLDAFEKGIYLLKIQTDQGLVSKRVIVE